MCKRTTARLAKRFRRLYAGVVYDAMVFDCGIGPTECVASGGLIPLRAPRRPLSGPAFTCQGRCVNGGEVNDETRFEMLRHIRPGAVMVIDADTDEQVAHFGDISAQLARQHGAAGAVINGFTRDAASLARSGWPVFCQGIIPRDAFGWWHIIECQCRLLLSPEAFVEPNDWIFADADGVLVIPRHRVAEVCDAAEKRAKQEQRIRRALRKQSPEEVYRRYGRW